MSDSDNTQVALVTGASRGIGLAIARRLNANGFQVFGTATSSTGVGAIETHLGAGHGFVMNLAEAGSAEAVVAEIESHTGVISVLVNNAGMTRDQLLLRLKDEDWSAVIDANLTGTMRCTKAVLKGMVKQRFGRIVHLSSVVASSGNPGQTNYAAAKAGIEGFSRALSLEVASRGITSNVIAPGFIDTDMTQALSDAQREALLSSIPASRLGTGEDIASAVNFLVSAEAGYITGQTLHINGGMYLG